MAVQENAPTGMYVLARHGEFFLMDEERRMFVASAQRPAEWRALAIPEARPGAEEFSLYDGIHLLTEEGYAAYDPGPRFFGNPGEEPLLTPAETPYRFAPFSKVMIRPGTTYGFDGNVFRGRTNGGLLAPRLYGDAPDAPLRAHSIGKIVNRSHVLYALGELHPQTYGHAPGTQVLFKSEDNGVWWTFQLLPRLTGRWRDVAVAYDPDRSVDRPFFGQIVIVGDDGICTSRDDGATWLSITHNMTTATAAPWPLPLITMPEHTDASINEPITLRLNAVAWAGNRFVAAGRTLDGEGRPVYVEGLSNYWFAYPLAGWPAERTVDQIEDSSGRYVFLSHDAGPGAPALLAADVPALAEDAEGEPPVITAAAVDRPMIGTKYSYGLHDPAQTVRRYVIEGDDAEGWSISEGVLRAPQNPSRFSSGYLVEEEPIRLTITAINEFGRSAPLELTVDPELPAPPMPVPSKPMLPLPRTVRVPLGGAVMLPFTLKGPTDWSPSETWVYGLPEGVVYDWRASSLVGHASVPGVYRVDVLTITRAGASFAGPIELTVSEPVARPRDSAVFTGLLAGDDELEGLWTLTMRPDGKFTGKLSLRGADHAFRGELVADPEVGGTEVATVTIVRKGKPALLLDLVCHVEVGRLALYATAGDTEAATVGGAVARSPWAKDRLTHRAGRHIAAVYPPANQAEPVGTGFVDLNVGTTGKTTLRGELANGIKWTAATPLSANGDMPIFWKTKTACSLLGTVAFDPGTVVATKLRGSLAWRTSRAEVCPAYGADAELQIAGGRVPSFGYFYMHGAGEFNGTHSLVLEQAQLDRYGHGEGWLSIVVTADGKQPIIARGVLEANFLKLKISFQAATGLLSGKFTLTDQSVSRPKPRAFNLRGAVVTDPDSGEVGIVGYFLLPSVDGKTWHSGRVSSHWFSN